MNHWRQTAIGRAAGAAAATARARTELTATGDLLQLLFGQLFLVLAGVAHSIRLFFLSFMLFSRLFRLWAACGGLSNEYAKSFTPTRSGAGLACPSPLDND